MNSPTSGSAVDWTSEAAWAATRAPLSEATGLDPAAYTDESFFALEQQRVFERAWVMVGTAHEAAEPGRLLVRRLGQRSILVTRGADGVLRGFFNSCRHRGTELAEADCDIAGTIRCPYHRWGYRSDGTLAAAPFFEEIPRAGFDPADYSLRQVRVATWGPLLFACADPQTVPLEQWLGDLGARMAGYGFEQWRIQETAAVDVAANWKLIIENFSEYYHLPWVHPELAKVSRVADHYRYQGHGMYCGQTTTPVSGDERDDWLRLPQAAGLDDSDRQSGRFVAVFPNTMLAVLPNHVFVIRLDPTAAGATREHCTFLLPPSTPPVNDDDMAETRSFWFDVNDEDIDICERGQRGLSAGRAPAGPLAPRFEEPLHRFHNMLADCLTAESLTPAGGLRVPPGDDGSEESRLGTGVNPSPPAVDSERVGGSGPAAARSA